MSCAKCIHYLVCEKEFKPDCLWFEDRNNFIKLPVYLNDTVYVNTYVDGMKSRGIETIKCFVASIRLKNDCKTITFCCHGNYHSGMPYTGNFVNSSIGRTVFYNEQDALIRATLK